MKACSCESGFTCDEPKYCNNIPSIFIDFFRIFCFLFSYSLVSFYIFSTAVKIVFKWKISPTQEIFPSLEVLPLNNQSEDKYSLKQVFFGGLLTCGIMNLLVYEVVFFCILRAHFCKVKVPSVFIRHIKRSSVKSNIWKIKWCFFKLTSRGNGFNSGRDCGFCDCIMDNLLRKEGRKNVNS